MTSEPDHTQSAEIARLIAPAVDFLFQEYSCMGPKPLAVVL